MELAPSPVVALNRAVAIGEAGDLGEGLALIDAIEGLERYHLLYAARADMLRRLGRVPEALDAYGRALTLTGNPAERAFLERRIGELER
jgi:RNA polymerase sigma-70 factor (ECF subfamily)